MLNLDWAISQFVSNPPRWAPGELEADRDVVRAMTDSTDVQRRNTLLQWMERYSSLLGFSREKKEEACDAILHFADGLPPRIRRLNTCQIVAHFEALEAQLRPIMHADRNGLSRDITSLTSKALWCCLPEDAPIFDRNTRSALAMLARLMDVEPDCEGLGYVSFVDLWMRIYDRLAPRIYAVESIQQYGHRVRFFDRFLWFLGNPDLCSGGYTLASSADL